MVDRLGVFLAPFAGGSEDWSTWNANPIRLGRIHSFLGIGETIGGGVGAAKAPHFAMDACHWSQPWNGEGDLPSSGFESFAQDPRYVDPFDWCFEGPMCAGFERLLGVGWWSCRSHRRLGYGVN